jgi:hypothetical protein
MSVMAAGPGSCCSGSCGSGLHDRAPAGTDNRARAAPPTTPHPAAHASAPPDLLQKCCQLRVGAFLVGSRGPERVAVAAAAAFALPALHVLGVLRPGRTRCGTSERSAAALGLWRAAAAPRGLGGGGRRTAVHRRWRRPAGRPTFCHLSASLDFSCSCDSRLATLACDRGGPGLGPASRTARLANASARGQGGGAPAALSRLLFLYCLLGVAAPSCRAEGRYRAAWTPAGPSRPACRRSRLPGAPRGSTWGGAM